MENEPDVVGFRWDAHGYERVYAHHLDVEKRNVHYPDGTIEPYYVVRRFGSTDEKLGPALHKYAEELENTQPWETPPELPQHPDLRYSIVEKDIYRDGAGQKIPIPSEQTPTADTSDAPQTADTPADPLSEISQAYPEPLITEEEMTSWQEEFKALEAAELEELRILFEKGVGIPLERFMEMSDAEIEAEFQKQRSMAPSDLHFEKAPEKQAMSPQTTPPGNDMESSLREKYSSFRFRRAIATLNHHGSEEGLRRLQEIDPEVAKDAAALLQKQQAEANK